MAESLAIVMLVSEGYRLSDSYQVAIRKRVIRACAQGCPSKWRLLFGAEGENGCRRHSHCNFARYLALQVWALFGTLSALARVVVRVQVRAMTGSARVCTPHFVFPESVFSNRALRVTLP